MKRALAWAVPIAACWALLVALWIAAGPIEQKGAKADYAVVLGAAVNGTQPSPVFAARIDHAIMLYRAGRVRGVVFTGGRSAEDTFSEAQSAAVYACARGVPESAIVLEQRSRTTSQNLEQAAIMLGKDRKVSLLIVTDPLHMRRAMAIAERAGLDASPSSASGTRYRSWLTKVPFVLREMWFMHVYWLFRV